MRLSLLILFLEILTTTKSTPLPNLSKPLINPIFSTINSLSKRDNPFSLYICTIANWSIPQSCEYYRGKAGDCINVAPPSVYTIRGFGPDRYQLCRLYDQPDCAQDANEFAWLDLEWPGIGDLRENGWAYRLRSWRCVAEGTEPLP
jgi:hypothetical protein